MTNENDPDGLDDLFFSLADDFHAGLKDLPRQTGVQWRALRDDSLEPPTDVVVLTDALLASVAPPPGHEEAALDTLRSPVERALALPIPFAAPNAQAAAGPTTKEALQAIRPNRWVAVSIAALVGVAFFGGLLLRSSPARVAAEGAGPMQALALPPLVEAPIEPTFEPFPAPAATPDREAEVAAAKPTQLAVPSTVAAPPMVTPAARPAAPVPIRRATTSRTTTTTTTTPRLQADALDDWQ
jgi:hypothetical protein